MALAPADMNIFQLASRGLLREKEAVPAYDMYAEYCGGKALGRRPGGDVLPYLAFRMFHGASAEQAAAREYLYRWSLALMSPVFGVPHLIGL